MVASLLAGLPNADAIVTRFAQLNEHMADRRAKEVQKECVKIATEQIAGPAKNDIDDITRSLAQSQQAAKEISKAANQAVNNVTPQRAEAIKKYDTEVKRITDDLSAVKIIANNLKSVSNDIQAKMNDATLDNMNKAEDIRKLGDLEKQLKTGGKHGASTVGCLYCCSLLTRVSITALIKEWSL